MEIESTTPSAFVSSTVKEFRDLRSAIAYTMRTQGFNVYLSEVADFDIRGDRSAFEECFTNIRNCDFYILLIGNTRGNLFQDSISITRQEYRVAREAFRSADRPYLLLYLRDTSELALRGNAQDQRDAGIDDPDHLASFIGEVQSPGVEGVPNYLTRFRSFDELMNSLSGRLNLGRNLSEKLIRHSLLSELLSNLTLLVARSRGTLFPTHWYMSKVRKDIGMTPDDALRSINIEDDHATSLGISLVGRVVGENLHTRCIEDALDRGVFLTFDPTTGIFQESLLHQSLQQTLEDIQSLRQLDTSTGGDNWDRRIQNAIQAYRHKHVQLLEIPGILLATSFAHYDRTENILRGHLALCKVLLGLTEEIPYYQRQPLTPFGEQEALKMETSRVSGVEISKLIKNDTWPFGSKIPSERFGETREEQVRNFTDLMYKNLEGSDEKVLEGTKDILKKIAEDYLDKGSASSEEGIENRNE